MSENTPRDKGLMAWLGGRPVYLDEVRELS